MASHDLTLYSLALFVCRCGGRCLNIDNLLIAPDKQTDYQENDTEEKADKPHEARDKATTDCGTSGLSSSIFGVYIDVLCHETSRVDQT